MDNILRAINKVDTLERAKDIINSVNDNQMASKDWLFDHLPPHEHAVVLGGWYGYVASNLSSAVTIDMDPGCEMYGKIMYPHVKFVTADAFDYMIDKPKYDLIINTSCEHMNQDQLTLMFNMKRKNSMVAFQSNNYFGARDHINCKETLDKFISDYPFKEIIYKGELDRGKYQRWMVIGI